HWSIDGKRLYTLTEDDYFQVWDLTNGEPLTPPRKVQEDRTTPFHTLASAQPGDDLPLDDRPVADLVQLSQMLAFARVDAAGNVVPLQLQELTNTTRLLREKYPEQFKATPAEALAWHKREALESEAEGDLSAALFHIDRSLKQDPSDQRLLQKRVEMASLLANTNHEAFRPVKLSRRFPSRDPEGGGQQIDLSAHYNLGLQESVDGLDGNNFAELPVGLQTFGDVRFDVRGILCLAHEDGPN